MKYIKTLALVALAAAALAGLNACEAKAQTTSTGASAGVSTTRTSK